MGRLCKILSNEELLGELINATSPEDLILLHNKYCVELGE